MFKVIDSSQEFLKVVSIRSIVFIHEQSCPYLEEVDGLDNEAQHILGEIDSEPFACGRIRYINDYAKLERIAIRKQWRKKGYGDALVKFMIEEANRQGVFKLKIHAQTQALRFYEKLCFKPYGEQFLEAGIKHVKMIRNR